MSNSSKSVVAVYGRTSTGRRVRIVNSTEETAASPAGFEIGLRRDADGQWRMTWLPECEVSDLEFVEEVVVEEDVPVAMAA